MNYDLADDEESVLVTLAKDEDDNAQEKEVGGLYGEDDWAKFIFDDVRYSLVRGE